MVKFRYTRCLSKNAVNKFKDVIPPLLSSSVQCAKTMSSSYLKSAPTEVDYLVNNYASYALDIVAPLKKKVTN